MKSLNGSLRATFNWEAFQGQKIIGCGSAADYEEAMTTSNEMIARHRLLMENRALIEEGTRRFQWLERNLGKPQADAILIRVASVPYSNQVDIVDW